MTVEQHEVDALVEYCKRNLGEQHLWATPGGYPDSLALCIIDAIYSTGSHYNSVVNVINKYRRARGHNDGASGLLCSINDAGGPRAWAKSVAGNEKPAHTRPGAPLKAEVIEQAARLMVDLRIDTVGQLVDAVQDSPKDNPVLDRWTRLPSQSSKVTYHYLLILIGLPSVKPDRMVLRFLERALGPTADLSTDRAVQLISAAAKSMEVSTSALDHVIWRAASGRELLD